MGNPTTWTFDAETGVYKNHALSGQLLETAARKFVFVPFTDKIKDFGRRMGETITLLHYKELTDPTSFVLDESTRIPIDKLVMGSTSLTVQEWGRGVQYTSLAQDLGKFDVGSQAQKKLMRQIEKAMDGAAATAFKNAKVCFIPTSLTGGVWDTDGTPSTQALVNLNADHLGIIRDYMATSLHVPFYDGANYVGVFATLGLRGLKQDRRFEAWNMYLRKGEVIFRSECGRCEQIRLVENTNTAALTNGVGSSSVLGEGIVFGEEAVSRAEVEFPHLRANPNFQGDFGRMRACAWYGVVAFGPTWATANDTEAKIVRITSS